jgi:UDP-N-acetyl-D-galactosamine dehydrogenase
MLDGYNMSANSIKLPEQIAVVGLGYVGLPLAVAFTQHFYVIGFDINHKRVAELRQGYDANGEISQEYLLLENLYFTDDPNALKVADFYIITVPTPVDQAKRPDLSPLKVASCLVGRSLKKGTTVVYESTVYPGCTEEVCVPILERESGLKSGRDFKVGYSPERVNPGDPEHTLENVIKVVAGQDEETTELIARVYGLVVKVGIYKAPNIRTAEAAKVIENVQRDLNIALMNELAILFHSLGLDTQEVLKAARTKWNFLPFEPGLVGGHCIPVDPYYLTYKAQEVGYHPEVILAGRRINDSMGLYVARETIKLLIQAGKIVKGAKVLILGVAFKENVRDVRNTRVVELVKELQKYGINVEVHDPLVNSADLQQLGLKEAQDPFVANEAYDAIILTVPHDVFRGKPLEAYVRLLRNDNGPSVLVDVKGVFREAARETKVLYWSL